MKIVVDLPEKISTNNIYSGIHWGKRKTIKDQFAWATLSAISHSEKKHYNVPVYIRFDFKLKGRLLDASNCSFMGKMIEDALVKNKIIQDDNAKWVHGVFYTVGKGDNTCNVEIIESETPK